MIIDEERIYENLERLSLFEDFAKFIAVYLEKKI